MGINISIIPARGGSKEIPRKNIKIFHGKPLIAHSIEAAQSARVVDKVIVSTDAKKITDISNSFGAEVIWRPDSLATDTASSEEALIHAVDTLEKDTSIEIDYVFFLQATSPLRPIGLVDQCFEKLKY